MHRKKKLKAISSNDHDMLLNTHRNATSPITWKLQWATTKVTHLVIKLNCFIVWVTFFPLFPEPMLLFLFLLLHIPQHLRNIERGGGGGGGSIRELTLHPNKIKQMLKYPKASFPRSQLLLFLSIVVKATRAKHGISSMS